jgi:hypothetical protein
MTEIEMTEKQMEAGLEVTEDQKTMSSGGAENVDGNENTESAD